MSGNSRVIFSVYQEVKDYSVTSYKKQQLKLHKEKLAKRQYEYAKFCGADYFVYETDEFHIDDYNSIQFMKIKQFEELAKDYDEVLYIDLDVVPLKFVNFFEENDLSKLCCRQQDCYKWGLERFFLRKNDRYRHFDSLDSQNWWVKSCSKNAMLVLDNGSNFNNMLINTGVLGGNSDIIKQIKFTDNLERMISLLYEAKEDNPYPKEIGNFMNPNNEVFLSYLVEKEKIPISHIGKKWNFILDDTSSTINLKKHDVNFIHIINKHFERYFNTFIF